jgi:hypothetical protein
MFFERLVSSRSTQDIGQSLIIETKEMERNYEGVSQLIRCSSFLCDPSGFATFNIATNGCSACTGGSSVEDFNYKVLWSLSRIR